MKNNLDMENDNSSDADDILKKPITTKEIHDHISDTDYILNEMIKLDAGDII